MNKFLSALERKAGRYAVPQLTKYMILTYIVGYIIYYLSLAGIPIINYIYLSPEKILQGQIWRLFTWIFMPPSAPSIFTIIMLLFYYQIGTALEQTWGDFKYNLYIFSGLIFMVVGAFVLFAFHYSIDGMFTTYYINMSIFLAFAACYPDMQILLYFIIPLKIKYLAIVDLVFLAYQALVSSWAERVAIIVSLLNFVIFFFTTRNYRSISPSERARKRAYRNAFEGGKAKSNPFGAVFGAKKENKANGGDNSSYSTGNTDHRRFADRYKDAVKDPGNITKHRCAICGRTELDGDNLEFRFCSKCAGNYEYCQDHLFSHAHVKFDK